MGERIDLNRTGSFPEGVDEIVLRVSRYDFADGKPFPGDPAAWQCWIDHRDCRVPRTCAIRANPVAALRAALAEFPRNVAEANLTGKPEPSPKSRFQQAVKRAEERSQRRNPDPETSKAGPAPLVIDPDLEDLI